MCNPDVVRTMNRKLAPPLVTLLNSEPEIQYVALRNINLIVQKRPAILEHEIKVPSERGWGGGHRRGCRVRTSVVGGCGEMFMERDAD